MMPTQLMSALTEQVKDLYSAENQLLRALPRMAKAAASEKLRAGFEAHLDETRGHVERLLHAAEILETKPGGKKCVAMEGLVKEGAEAVGEHDKGPLRDALLIAAAQRAEHYEIAAYGTVRAMAQHLGKPELVRLFTLTLDEEKNADAKLTKVSESDVLPQASRLDDRETESEHDTRDGRAASNHDTGARAAARGR